MRRLLYLSWFLFLLPAVAFGATRDNFHQQGILLDVDGNAVEGFHNMAFRLYETQEGGEAIWEETLTVNFSAGFYSLDLGESTALDESLFESADDLYVGITIDGEEEFVPRFPLASVPFARVADVAARALAVDDDIVLPRVFITDFGEVINASGQWVGPAITSVLGASIDGSEIVDGTIRDADISSTAAIAWSKVSKTGALPGEVGAAATLHSHAAGDVTSGELVDARISDTLTIGATGSVADGALSSNVSRLGATIESSEITDGTIVNADINTSAAIAGTKVSPDFGSQNVTTTGDLSASGGFKMMAGPFQENNVEATRTKQWAIGTEDNAVEDVALPWAGSVMGVSVSCTADVTAGSLSVEPLVNGSATGLTASLSDSGGTSDRSASASQAKDLDTFSAGATVGCRAVSASLAPTTLECACLVFVEM